MRDRNLLAPIMMACLLVAGVGAATSFLRDSREAIGSGYTTSLSRDGEMLARLKDYTQSTGTEQPRPMATPDNLLPDVNTMIERLAARLETMPEDVRGWRMLGWSYFHTGHYEKAVSAYARAIKLDPSSEQLKLSYEEAKAKSSAPGGEKNPEAMPPRDRPAHIRSMVDGLANRLKDSPRDADGWIRLMRSHIVLGEREVAAEASRQALEVFKDDPAASESILAAALELGLKAE